MMTIEDWKALKQFGQSYPEQPFEIGKSNCCWLDSQGVATMAKVAADLPANSVCLELGSFLGAGSTRIFLDAHPTLRMICVDSFTINSEVIAESKRNGIDVFGPDNKFVDPNARPRARVPVDFMQGIGTALEHFINNTWDCRERVVPIQSMVNADSLLQLHELGVRPDFVYIDDDHQHEPVLERLRFISKYWPEAVVMLDDYANFWPGVITGVQAAWDEKMYKQERCELHGHRVMVMRGE